MSTPVTIQPKDTQIGTVAQHATILPPEDYVPLTADSLFVFCQTRLQAMDKSIALKMAGQKGLIALQSQIGFIQTSLKAPGKGGGGDTAFNDTDKVKDISDQLDAAIKVADDTGNGTTAETLRKVKATLHQGPNGGDNLVSKDELKDMSTMLDNASSDARSGAEVSMIELQSLVSQRATALQLTMGMMNSINEGSKSIAANIGRG